ncbi:hypothetical protein AJ80_05181 [Polytolypa hystricis UAMH7299]|uniref:WD domain, G-beta repeat protein n=1 Tax=Polytolypa hystricis (strain UAMH7299) TaxID=1447883 RepID=A0A2B7Y4S6_POLH7|nr:hypothetical protein AJ80_05181 [Polytolypa hystricis UAMH7299]
MSVEQLARHRSGSSGSRSASGPLIPPSPPYNPNDGFEPCAATASMFLFAQSSSVLCLHHDTLAVERRFERHEENIQFVCVDNVSERGAGRLVVSYDVGQTAIIWDLFTGSEISRFASFEPIRTASWMRNGNVSFGNAKGEVILFEPSTSEHISARTIFDPITSLAPANDCRTYAIGYQNGSILIASLQPNFNILHTLTTSRAPAPVVSLAWHASSTKQKSDMLASQTTEGDLMVWSVSKHPLMESPRVIRVLKRSEYGSIGPKWLAWSKNGRIVQFSEGETWAWDVRTKHVTYEPVPTVQGVRGVANYGPTATFFTLGPDHTVQQYDLSDSATLVADVQHLPVDSHTAPETRPKPPQSEPALTSGNLSQHTNAELKERTKNVSPMVKKEPFDMATLELARQDRNALASPVSERSQTNSISSASSRGYNRGIRSPQSRSIYSGTTFSMSSPVRSVSDMPLYTGNSLNYAPSVSTSRSYRGGSRLRHELIPSPVDKPITELLPYTRGRLNDVPYQPPRPLDENNLTPEDLRRQMLSVVFGWDSDIEDLIRDELARHPVGSQNSVFLGRWLGDSEPDVMANMISPNSSAFHDWMLLALSQLGNTTQTKKLGQTLVQKLLAKGDIHASAAVLIGMGDRNDAIEVYVSRHQYMEAILLTCLIMPSEWQRQAYLVRKWGEHVVQNSQQHLAIRCFSCTAVEPSEPWASPTAQMTSLLSEQMARQGQESPILNFTPSAATGSGPATKNPALKLITSFDPNPGPLFKFPGLMSADRTPTNAPGVTPIADSALVESATRSPGAPGYFGRHNNNSARTLSARAVTPIGYAKQRLSSIGETPVDVMSPTFPAPRSLPTPVDSGSEREKEKAKEKEEVATENPGLSEQPTDDPSAPPLLLTSARYDPKTESRRETPQTAFPPSPKQNGASDRPMSPSIALAQALAGHSRSRNGSRDRKPEGLHIQWPPVQLTQSSVGTSGDSPSALRRSMSHKANNRDGDSIISPALTANSARSARSAATSVRSIDPYISSLDEASYYSKHHRGSRERHNSSVDSPVVGHPRQSSRVRSKERRGRSHQRYIQPAKRSPSSPIPMSPEDLALYTSNTENTDDQSGSRRHRSRSEQRDGTKVRGSSKIRDRVRSRSPLRAAAALNDRNSSRTTVRRHSPEAPRDRTARRGRSKQRELHTGLRSPSSPLPMSPPTAGFGTDRDVEDNLRLVNVDRKHRLRSRQRSSSRRPERGTSSRRDSSPDRRRGRERSQSRQPYDHELSASHHRYAQGIDAHLISPIERQPPELQGFAERAKKEIAAAELEARRLSLQRRPSVPAIPLPGETPTAIVVRPRAADSPLGSGLSFSQRATGRPNISPANSNYSDSNSSGRGGASSVSVGLPATPRAMRHPKYSTGYTDATPPAVPEIPDSFSLDQISLNVDQGIQRAMSAPPEEVAYANGLPAHPHFQRQIPSSRISKYVAHRREGSLDMGKRSPTTSRHASIDAAIDPTQIFGLENAASPPLLPELQHLQPPPPPPPPPVAPEQLSASLSEERNSLSSGVGTINILIDDKPGTAPPTTFVEPPIIQRPATTAPLSSLEVIPAAGRRSAEPHRRGRSVNENLTSKIRSFTGRMRSTSRGPTRSPPAEKTDGPSPYESISISSVMDNKI